MALAYLTINLDAFTGDDHPPVPSYSTITLDPGADHIDAAADVIHVRTIVVSLDRQGKAATANGVPCVDGKVPVVAGVMYAVLAPNVLRDGPHYIPALTAGQVVDLSDYITPGAPLTPDQAAILTARIKALETTPPDHGALTGLSDDDHAQYALADGTRGAFAAPLGADDNYVTDAEKAALHGHSNKAALDLVSGTNTGDQVLPTWSTISGKPAVVAEGATQADARAAIGAGTSSFSGAYADLSGKPTLGDAAGELVAARLDTAVTDITVGIAGDSTGNDSNEWVRAWLATIGPRYPNLRIEYGLWSDALAAMQSPLAVLQAGVGATIGGPGVVSDTFTRTDADLVGDAADTGQIWAGTVGKWSTNGTAAVCTGSGDMTIPVGASGDMTVTANVTLDTTAAAGAKTLAVYSNWLSANNHLWAQVNVSTGGVITATLFKRIAGTSTSIGTFAALGLTPAAPNTFNMSINVSGLNVVSTINGVSVSATISEGDLAALGSSAGFGSRAASTAGATVNTFTVDTPIVATGQRLIVYNGSHPGSTLAYQSSRVAAQFPTAPDVVIINSGHNYGAGTATDYLTAVDNYITAVHAVYPAARIIVSSQNPEFSPAANRVAHARRLTELRVHALANGYGYVPAHEAFLNEPDGGVSFVMGDGIHPTPAGSALWAATFDNYLTSKSLRTP